MFENDEVIFEKLGIIFFIEDTDCINVFWNDPNLEVIFDKAELTVPGKLPEKFDNKFGKTFCKDPVSSPKFVLFNRLVKLGTFAIILLATVCPTFARVVFKV